MSTYLAPAKVNLSLLVSSPRADGYHPLESLVQTLDWCDRLDVESGQEGRDTLQSDIEENLVEKALYELRKTTKVPPLDIRLVKEIPLASGLGGGSSDAAAALVAGADFAGVEHRALSTVAWLVGADVALFLTGGTVMMSGVGDEIETVRPLEGFAVAVVVPEFGLITKDVYARWDTLRGPEGPPVPEESLPPPLRGGMPLRNDLLPAALSLEPRLGDFMADVAAVWGTAVSLTGSGSACFGYFPTVEEAGDAAAAVAGWTKQAKGVDLRDRGVTRLQI